MWLQNNLDPINDGPKTSWTMVYALEASYTNSFFSNTEQTCWPPNRAKVRLPEVRQQPKRAKIHLPEHRKQPKRMKIHLPEHRQQ